MSHLFLFANVVDDRINGLIRTLKKLGVDTSGLIAGRTQTCQAVIKGVHLP